MRGMLRGLLISVMTLCLSLWGLAGNSAGGGEQMVLCSGGQVVIVFVDGQGAPTQTPHFLS